MKKKFTVIIGTTGLLLVLQSMNAQVWTVTKRITWSSGWSHHPAIAVNSSNQLFVVWYEDTPGNNEIYYTTSTNEGKSWSSKRLTWNPGNSQVPVIAVDSNDSIHVIWNDKTPGNWEIFYRISTNEGITWAAKRLTWNPGDSSSPSIAIDGNDKIHVVWSDSTPGYDEIFYKSSTNEGKTWTSKRLTWTEKASWFPDLAVDSNNHIHVVWQDDTPGNFEIYHKRSTDEGISWTSKRITWTSGDSWGPEIAVDSSGHIHVTWQDDTSGNQEIYYKKSTDGGLSWMQKQLTWNYGSSAGPAIAVDTNGRIHVTWNDATPGNSEIYYMRSTDGGISWIQKRLTWTPDSTWSSAIITDAVDQIHVVWKNFITGGYEIYYKRGIQ